MAADGYNYYLKLSLTYSPATKIVATTVNMPTYITNFGNYRIRYIQLLMDKTALTANYSHYKF